MDLYLCSDMFWVNMDRFEERRVVQGLVIREWNGNDRSRSPHYNVQKENGYS